MLLSTEGTQEECMDFLKLLEGIRTPLLDGVFSIVTYLGDELVFMAGVLLILWCINKKWGYRLFIIGLTGSMLNQLLKAMFTVPRPWIIDPEFTIVESAREAATGYSFPSGHTQSAATFFGGIAAWRRSTKATVVCTLLVLITGFSRMYLGVHTPADVLTSLATGLVTVLVFSWAFSRSGNSQNGKYAIGGAALALAVILLCYVSFAPKGANNVAEFDAHGVKNGYTMLGTMLGLCAAYLLDEKHIQYEIKAVWWAQALKYIIGLGILVAIKSGIKAPLLALFNGNVAADGVRYFIMTLFGGAVWPLTFKWWGRLGTNNK